MKDEGRMREIYGLCNRRHPAMNNEFFAKWFIAAFPDEYNTNYINEWIDRFSTGTPFYYMDTQRLKVYKEELNRSFPTE